MHFKLMMVCGGVRVNDERVIHKRGVQLFVMQVPGMGPFKKIRVIAHPVMVSFPTVINGALS